MGFNSVVFICNDVMDQIDKDPAGWWKETQHALMSHKCCSGTPVNYGFGISANGFWAVRNQHADVITLASFGGNYPNIVLEYPWGWGGHHKEEDQVKLLRMAAGKLGYNLAKKPAKRKRDGE